MERAWFFLAEGNLFAEGKKCNKRERMGYFPLVGIFLWFIRKYKSSWNTNLWVTWTAKSRSQNGYIWEELGSNLKMGQLSGLTLKCGWNNNPFQGKGVEGQWLVLSLLYSVFNQHELILTHTIDFCSIIHILHMWKWNQVR